MREARVNVQSKRVSTVFVTMFLLSMTIASARADVQPDIGQWKGWVESLGSAGYSVTQGG